VDNLLHTLLGAALAVLGGFLAQRFQGRVWVAQERWRLKSDYYQRLLGLLRELDFAYHDCQRLEDPEAPGDGERKQLAEALARVNTLHRQLANLVTVAELWLPRDTFSEIIDVEIHLANRTSGEGKLWDSASSATLLLQQKLVMMARRDLKLSLGRS